MDLVWRKKEVWRGAGGVGGRGIHVCIRSDYQIDGERMKAETKPTTNVGGGGGANEERQATAAERMGNGGNGFFWGDRQAEWQRRGRRG